MFVLPAGGGEVGVAVGVVLYGEVAVVRGSGGVLCGGPGSASGVVFFGFADFCLGDIAVECVVLDAEAVRLRDLAVGVGVFGRAAQRAGFAVVQLGATGGEVGDVLRSGELGGKPVFVGAVVAQAAPGEVLGEALAGAVMGSGEGCGEGGVFLAGGFGVGEGAFVFLVSGEGGAGMGSGFVVLFLLGGEVLDAQGDGVEVAGKGGVGSVGVKPGGASGELPGFVVVLLLQGAVARGGVGEGGLGCGDALFVFVQGVLLVGEALVVGAHGLPVWLVGVVLLSRGGKGGLGAG